MFTERCTLLTHLALTIPLCEMSPSGQVRSGREIDAKRLEAVLVQKSNDSPDSELQKKMHIIKMILYVRGELELYIEGGSSGKSK